MVFFGRNDAKAEIQYFGHLMSAIYGVSQSDTTEVT